MTIKVLFFSDTHLGFDYPVRGSAAPARRGADFFANFQRVLDHAQATRPDLVIHGGDLFFRSRLPPLIVDMAYQALFEFAGHGIPIVIVPGNHERSELPASLFLSHPHIHVLDRPRTYSFDVGSERLAVSGFPYLKNIRRTFRNALAELGPRPDADYRLLCLHHAIDGATVGPAGFVFSGAADVIARRELPECYDAVLAGHVHRHQILGDAQPIVYCGSVERTSFAEQNEAKGFCQLTLAQDECGPEIDFHELPTRPMVDFDARGARLSDVVDAFDRESARWRSDAIVRIRLDRYPDRNLRLALTSVAGQRMQLGFTIRSKERQGRVGN